VPGATDGGVVAAGGVTAGVVARTGVAASDVVVAPRPRCAGRPAVGSSVTAPG
jgi:hypothetical protein